MKIDYIKNYNLKQYQQNYHAKPEKRESYAEISGKLPSTASYISFLGGKSINLRATVEQLDRFAQKKSNVYPPNIREWIGMIFEKNNEVKDTLISVHRKYFSTLNDCYSLDDIKKSFPEFKNVLSSADVEVKNGSFIDRFQKGELEYFDNDEDLAAQLIKLYWGQGFSLTDLMRYSDGVNLYSVMKKLNIPTASKEYGHYLKLSDVEYNERLTKEMTEKRLAALDRKAQEQDGEPVYIKRGHLTPEHKQRISEGLKRFYAEHPERIYEMSERQKAFYRENPKQGGIFKFVLERTWALPSSDNIKRALSKFFQKHNINFDLSANPAELTAEQSRMMSKFWADNPWASEVFSKNMKLSWKKVQEEYDRFYEIDIVPEGFKEKFYAWVDKKGIDLSGLDFRFKIYKYQPDLNDGSGPELSKYTPKFIDEYNLEKGVNQSDMLANTYILALFNVSKELGSLKLSKMSPQSRKNLTEIRNLIRECLIYTGPGSIKFVRNFDTQTAQQIYTTALFKCIEFDYPAKYIELFNRQLNTAYNTIESQSLKQIVVTRDMLNSVLK